MKTQKERKIRNSASNTKSKHMKELNNKEDSSKKIKEIKEKQRKLFKIIRDEMRKAEQFRISIDGLQNLSDASVKSIQIRREKTLSRTKITINELLENSKMLKNAEKQYRKHK